MALMWPLHKDICVPCWDISVDGLTTSVMAVNQQILIIQFCSEATLTLKVILSIACAFV